MNKKIEIVIKQDPTQNSGDAIKLTKTIIVDEFDCSLGTPPSYITSKLTKKDSFSIEKIPGKIDVIPLSTGDMNIVTVKYKGEKIILPLSNILWVREIEE